MMEFENWELVSKAFGYWLVLAVSLYPFFPAFQLRSKIAKKGVPRPIKNQKIWSASQTDGQTDSCLLSHDRSHHPHGSKHAQWSDMIPACGPQRMSRPMLDVQADGTTFIRTGDKTVTSRTKVKTHTMVTYDTCAWTPNNVTANARRSSHSNILHMNCR